MSSLTPTRGPRFSTQRWVRDPTPLGPGITQEHTFPMSSRLVLVSMSGPLGDPNSTSRDQRALGGDRWVEDGTGRQI